MEVDEVAVFYYEAPNGRCPFRDWLDDQEASVQGLVAARLARLRRGLFGDAKSLGGGLFELRLHAGPGYRIYYGREGRTVVILLDAGSKRGQASDIEVARRHWNDFLRRNRT